MQPRQGLQPPEQPAPTPSSWFDSGPPQETATPLDLRSVTCPRAKEVDGGPSVGVRLVVPGAALDEQGQGRFVKMVRRDHQCRAAFEILQIRVRPCGQQRLAGPHVPPPRRMHQWRPVVEALEVVPRPGLEQSPDHVSVAGRLRR